MTFRHVFTIVLFLTLQLEVALQPPFIKPPLFNGGTHRAAGLTAVGAIIEAAAQGQLFYIGKHRTHPLLGLGQLEFPHAGTIEDDASLGQLMQGPMRGGMAAFGVVFAYRLSRLQRRAA